MRKKGCVFINTKNERCINECEFFDNNRKSFFCKTHKNKKLNYGIPLSAIYWRSQIMGTRSIPINYVDCKYLEEVPYDTRQLAIKTAVANMKACITNLKSGRIKTFHIKQKSKYFRKQFFHVDHRALIQENKEFCLFTKIFNKESLEMKEKKWLNNYFNKYTNIDYKNTDKNKLVSKHRHDMIVTYDSGRYFLIVPYEKKVKENKIKNKIVAIDPGVRTFHTFYYPDGTYGDLGENLDRKLIKIHKKRDKLISKISIYNNDLEKIHESEIELDELHEKRIQINNKANDENLKDDQIKKYMNRLKKIKCKRVKEAIKKETLTDEKTYYKKII